MLGLKHGQNLLFEYDPQWPLLFEEERAKLAAALAGIACAIEHYGSTAVPGLAAKPILDILVGVSPLENWLRCKTPLEQLGYDYAMELASPITSSLAVGGIAVNGRTWCMWLSLRVSLGATLCNFAKRCDAISCSAKTTSLLNSRP